MGEGAICASLYILNLFADLFEFRFRVDDVLGEGCVVGFGADRVEFAVEFLAEEVEGAADGIAAGEVFVEFAEVGAEAGGFLGDVAAVGEEGDFLEDAVVVEAEVESGFAEAAEEGVTVGGDDCGGFCFDLTGLLFELAEAMLKVCFQVIALRESHGDEAGDGVVEGGFDGGEDGFRVGVFFEAEDIGGAEKVFGIGDDGAAEGGGEFDEGGVEGFGFGGVELDAGGDALGVVEFDLDGDAAAGDALEDAFAEGGFELAERAGHVQGDFSLLTVHGGRLDVDNNLAGGVGAAPESGHAVHEGGISGEVRLRREYCQGGGRSRRGIGKESSCGGVMC